MNSTVCINGNHNLSVLGSHNKVVRAHYIETRCPECDTVQYEDISQLHRDAKKWQSLPLPVREALEDCKGMAQIIPT